MENMLVLFCTLSLFLLRWAVQHFELLSLFERNQADSTVGLFVSPKSRPISQLWLFFVLFNFLSILFLYLVIWLFKVYCLHLVFKVINNLRLGEPRASLSPSVDTINLDYMRLLGRCSQSSPIVFFVSSNLCQLILPRNLFP